MNLLRMIAGRADVALFGTIAARVGWALAGAALGLWQGPVAMLAFAFGLVAVSETLSLLARLPASPRRTPRPQALVVGKARTV